MGGGTGIAVPGWPDQWSPLARHGFVETTSPVVARREMSRIFAPHDLVVHEPRAAFEALHRHVRLRTLSLNFIRYRPAVDVGSIPTKNYFILLVPLSGHCRIVHGDDSMEVAPGAVGVVNRTRPIRLEWRDDCALIAIKVFARELERSLAARLGFPPREPVAFDGRRAVPWQDCPTLIDLVRTVCLDLDGPAAFASGLAEAEIESLILALMLAQLPHNHSAALRNPVGRIAPYYVKRAEEFIQTNADSGITLRDMVAVSGVSARTLFKGFRDHRGMGPVAFLKSVRLERVRAELSSPAARGRTVTEIATSWGFTHLGNFARDYRRRYGETPSQTLRRGPP